MGGLSVITYALCNGRIKSALSGIANITQTPNGFKITTNDGQIFEYVVQNMHQHSNLDNVLEKFTLDANGELLFDGKSLNSDIVNLFSLNTSNGDLVFNGNKILTTKDEAQNSDIILPDDWI